jgi:biotin transport system substrate-specific component
MFKGVIFMNKFSIKRISINALMLALLIVLAQISIPTPFGVPIVLQNLGIFLIGLFLKKYDSFLVICTYIFLGSIGLPVFAGGSSGLAILIGISGGYLFGFPIVAFLISWFMEKTQRFQTTAPKTLATTITATTIFGVLFLDFIPGALGMHFFGKMPLMTAEKYQFTFIIFDLVKAISAGFIFVPLAQQLKKQSPSKI